MKLEYSIVLVTGVNGGIGRSFVLELLKRGASAPLPEPKLMPEDVASGTLDALEAGEDEVFPGALSQGTAQAFRSDPAAFQAHMASLVHPIG